MSAFWSKSFVSSGDRWFWPDEKRLNIVSSGEKPVWPDGRDTAKIAQKITYLQNSIAKLY